MITKRIVNLDASKMSNSACIRYIFNTVVLAKTADTTPINDMEFGSAWHVFREKLALTKNQMTACSEGMKYWKMRETQGMIFSEKKEHLNPDYLMFLFLKYISECGVEKSWGKYDYIHNPATGEPMVEQTFSILIYEDEYLKVYLQGTIDEWVKYVAGFLCLGDDKTSSTWDIFGHLKSFEMKVQGMVYLLAVKLLAFMPGGEWYQEVRQRRIGFRINGVYLKTDKNKTEFQMSKPYFFEDSVLDALHKYLLDYCMRLSFFVKEGITPPPEGRFNDSCGGKFNRPCEFFDACRSSESAYSKILGMFATKEYEPLMFRK